MRGPRRAPTIGGSHTATYDDGDTVVQMDGVASYRSRAKGKPFVMRLADKRPKVIFAPVTYGVETDAEIAFRDGGSFECDLSTEQKQNLVGVIWVSPSGVRVQWTLTPAGFKCPFDAGDARVPQFDLLSANTQTTRFPLRRFTKKTATIPIRINWSGGEDGWKREITWTGTVKIAR